MLIVVLTNGDIDVDSGVGHGRRWPTLQSTPMSPLATTTVATIAAVGGIGVVCSVGQR